MRRPIQTGSKTTTPGTNGAGRRKCQSWIDSFCAFTDNLESPTLFRRWSAIATIAAVLEQKVWLTTSSAIYPNLYTFLVGHPGVGKNRAIRAAKAYMSEVPDFHFAPTSMTMASLVDALLGAKRMIVRLPDAPLEYNSMTITAEELTAFMHKYDDEMIGGLSAFYDPDPYEQHRRGKDIRIKIKRPQLTILSGTTPSNLVKFMPEVAWDQGFTSRIILVFSDERTIGDDFAMDQREILPDMVHDIKVINSLVGEYKVTEEYRTAVNNWRQLGEPPKPNHPKLVHYNTRRKVHLYKLSMVAAADRSNTLLLTKDDFNTAMGWLLGAEASMPDIFESGASGSDAKAMDEIHHYVTTHDIGHGVDEHKIINFARERVPAHAVMRVLEIMERSGMIAAIAVDKKTGMRLWSAPVR